MFTDRAELDPRPVFICDWCGRTIYEAEYYYYLDHGDIVVCEDCIANCKEVAEYDPD